MASKSSSFAQVLRKEIYRGSVNYGIKQGVT